MTGSVRLDDPTNFLLPTARHTERHAAHPFRAGFFTLTNAIFGGGISLISLPLVARSAGLVLGSLVLIAGAFLTAFTLSLLVDCQLHTGWPTLYVLTCRAVGPWWAALGITFNIVGGNFLVCVALFIAAADMVVRCLHSFRVSRSAVLGVAFVLLLPLVLQRRLGALQYASAAAICGVFGFVCLAVATLLSEGMSSAAAPPPAFCWRVEALAALPLCCLAYACHFILLPVVHLMPPATAQRVMPGVIAASVAFSCVVYVVVVLAVNVKVGRGTLNGNILLNYSMDFQQRPWTATMGMAFVAALLFSIPLFHFVVREHVDAFLFPSRRPILGDDEDEAEAGGKYGAVGRHPPEVKERHSETPVPPATPAFRFVSLSVALLLGMVLLANAVRSVDTVLSYLGAAGSVTLSYILPGLIYVRVMPPKSWKWYGAAAVAALGFLLVPALLTVTTLQTFGFLGG
eukprot:EG_transcript_9627